MGNTQQLALEIDDKLTALLQKHESLQLQNTNLLNASKEVTDAYHNIQQRYIRLEETNKMLAEKCELLEYRIHEMTSEVETLKKAAAAVPEISSSFAQDQPDKEILKERVQELVAEVDRCIALLSK
jgi:predicted nuclease with TOPRIM domain